MWKLHLLVHGKPFPRIQRFQFNRRYVLRGDLFLTGNKLGESRHSFEDVTVAIFFIVCNLDSRVFWNWEIFWLWLLS